MSEQDIAEQLASMSQVLLDARAGLREAAFYEVYRQRNRYRRALEHIAEQPQKGWTELLASQALDSEGKKQPASEREADVRTEAAVNRGLAAALLQSTASGFVLMCQEGVPLEVTRRVLLHPELRRENDWHAPVQGVEPHAPKVLPFERVRRRGDGR